MYISVLSFLDLQLAAVAVVAFAWSSRGTRCRACVALRGPLGLHRARGRGRTSSSSMASKRQREIRKTNARCSRRFHRLVGSSWGIRCVVVFYFPRLERHSACRGGGELGSRSGRPGVRLRRVAFAFWGNVAVRRLSPHKWGGGGGGRGQKVRNNERSLSREGKSHQDCSSWGQPEWSLSGLKLKVFFLLSQIYACMCACLWQSLCRVCAVHTTGWLNLQEKKKRCTSCVTFISQQLDDNSALIWFGPNSPDTLAHLSVI